MKKSMVVLTIILMTILTACNKSGHSEYSKIYESYTKMENYTADIEVTVLSRGEKSDYKAKQYYLAPDLYRLDFKTEGMEEVSCVLEGDTLKYKNGQETTEFSDYIPNEKYYIFIVDFIEKYCKSEMAENTAEGKSTVFNLLADEGRPTMKLWVNSKTKSPEKMITYNEKGDETIIVKYSNFKMNTNLGKKIFDL